MNTSIILVVCFVAFRFCNGEEKKISRLHVMDFLSCSAYSNPREVDLFADQKAYEMMKFLSMALRIHLAMESQLMVSVLNCNVSCSDYLHVFALQAFNRR